MALVIEYYATSFVARNTWGVFTVYADFHANFYYNPVHTSWKNLKLPREIGPTGFTWLHI